MTKLRKLLPLLVLTLVGCALIPADKTHAAACSVKNPLGSVTYNVSVSQPGDYKLWLRLGPESKTANTIYLEIDGNTCLVAGNDDRLTPKTWSWVDYGGKETKKPLRHTFESAGKHSIKVIGNEAGVGVDRILLLSATDTCAPSNTVTGASQPGDNCKSEQATVAEPDGTTGDLPEAAGQPMSTTRKLLVGIGIFAALGVTGGGGFLLWRRNRFKLPGKGSGGTIVFPKQ